LNKESCKASSTSLLEFVLSTKTWEGITSCPEMMDGDDKQDAIQVNQAHNSHCKGAKGSTCAEDITP